MSNISRVYPIRTTRRRWNIPLFSYHKCTNDCNIIVVSDNSNQYVLLENPDYKNGKCSEYNKIKKTPIRIATFDINNPLTDIGELYNPDEKVICDNSFILSIYFPLSYVFEVVISTPSINNGFTLKELIYSIKNLYEYIYDEEERTASPQIYQLKKFCTNCGNKDLSGFIKDVKLEKELEEECSICYSNYNIEDIEDEKPVCLKCSHIFHNKCIKTWLENKGTCPICRHNIFECKSCDGTGIIYYTFSGAVLPIEERGGILARNHSNGHFGIHTYDFEDLLIENLHYDRTKRRLYMELSG